MTFDEYGYLTPYEIIEIDLETFEQTFVKAFENSDTRPVIFGAYLEYLNQLQEILGDGRFYQWTDGSFITQKQNPRDMDFVTFLDFEMYLKHKTQLNELRKQRYTGKKLLDNYFVPVFDKTNSRFSEFEGDRLYWLHLFEKDSRKIQKYKKGFLKLNF
jgi:hypothetical protein